MDLSNTASVYIGDSFLFANDITINNFYIACYAPSAAQIASVCYPNAYEGVDGAWDRRLWLRARNPDSATGAPYLASWAPGQSPYWFGFSEAALNAATPPWAT